MSQILIIEDNLHILDFLEFRLQSNGYETTAVSTGQEALYVEQSGAVDLAILSLELPKQDSFTVLKALREQSYALPIRLYRK